MTDTPAPKKAGREPGKPLSAAELAQRRAAALKSTGPRTEEGKAASSRNAWKHGMNSAVAKQSFRAGADSVAALFGKPCLRTCPIHPDNPDRDTTREPCSLVLEGVTNAGGSCLDKTVYVNAFTSLIAAMENGEMSGIQGVMAGEAAAMLQILNQLRTEIAKMGMVVRVPVILKGGEALIDKDGDIVYGDFKVNPALSSLIMLAEKLGISLPEMLATPQARSRAKTGEKAADTFSSLLGGIMQRGSAPPGRDPLPALPHEEGDA